MRSSTKKMPVPSITMKRLASLGPAMQELEQKLRNTAIQYSPDQRAAAWNLVQSYYRALDLL